ncbi:hypothetical protein WA158_003284 [Blastocystis sp. Blastoise]
MSNNDELFENIIPLRKCYFPTQSTKKKNKVASDPEEIVSVCNEIQSQVNIITKNILSKVNGIDDRKYLLFLLELIYLVRPLQSNYLNSTLEESILKIIYTKTGRVFDKSVPKNVKIYIDKICEFMPAVFRVHFAKFFKLEVKNNKIQYVAINGADKDLICFSSFIAKELLAENCKIYDFKTINGIVKNYLNDKRKNNNLLKLLGFKEILDEGLLHNEIIKANPYLEEFNWMIQNMKIAIFKIKDKEGIDHIYTADDDSFLRNNISKSFARHVVNYLEDPKKIYPFLENAKDIEKDTLSPSEEEDEDDDNDNDNNNEDEDDEDELIQNYNISTKEQDISLPPSNSTSSSPSLVRDTTRIKNRKVANNAVMKRNESIISETAEITENHDKQEKKRKQPATNMKRKK